MAGPDKAAARLWLHQIRLEHSPGAGEERSRGSPNPEGKPLETALQRGRQGTAVTWSPQDEVGVNQKHSRKADKLDKAGDAGGREHGTPAVCQHDAEVQDFASRRQNTDG